MFVMIFIIIIIIITITITIVDDFIFIAVIFIQNWIIITLRYPKNSVTLYLLVMLYLDSQWWSIIVMLGMICLSVFYLFYFFTYAIN